ncbi:sigma-70 family RNA polymerase sigma factor [Clostridium sp.]|uniref:sigma-70 family RNA polymerase sigma factor n=1 Tax=Clostridium sp. TaxID=1506 RepID=UPI001B7BC1A4|nr:sigma-70 family RNA polymerase sigma factor [Clostridium sp.]MBP3915718.1 sigma-70 family RNA polymerase sigma factor [Clostridium sp.]
MLLTKQEKEDYAVEHYKLIYHTCQKFANSSLQMEELLGYGQIGFVKALNSFEKDKNFKFSTFAVHCIKNEILLALRKENKYVTHTVSTNKPLHEDSSGNELVVEDILTDSLKEVNDTESEYIKSLDNEFIIKSLEVLNDQEKEIIILRFGLNGKDAKTQKEIADEINMSQANVSKIEKKALKKLKNIPVLKNLY